MLTMKDCVDYCALSDDELTAIQRGAHVNTLDACAIAHDAEYSPRDSRRVMKYLREYIEHLESKENDQCSPETLQMLDHFIVNHPVI